jgi:hypothetical protein
LAPSRFREASVVRHRRDIAWFDTYEDAIRFFESFGPGFLVKLRAYPKGGWLVSWEKVEAA